jgi:hypothetical protein
MMPFETIIWTANGYRDSERNNNPISRCTCEIKSRIATAKAAFNKKTLFTSKLDLNLRKKLVKCYI